MANDRRMHGTMLWFNTDKGHGFIHTEDGERLYVAHDGFLPDHDPPPRCKGLDVTFTREVHDDEGRAVDVAFESRDEPMRARLRTPRGGRSLW